MKGKAMTNFEKIQQELTIELLSKLLVQSRMIDNGDYDYEDNWVENYQETFSHPGACGNEFDYREDAEKDCLRWLKEKCEESTWIGLESFAKGLNCGE